MTATLPADSATRVPSADPLGTAYGAGAVIGPVLVLASSLAWLAGADEASGALQFYGAITVALGLVGLCARLAAPMPRAASVLAVVALIGFGAGGVGFAIDSLHVEVFGNESLAEGASAAGMLAPSLPGLLGPLSIVLIAGALLRHGLVARWSAVALIVGGIAFPVARIGEIPALAVGVDTLFLVALLPLGVRMFQQRALDS